MFTKDLSGYNISGTVPSSPTGLPASITKNNPAVKAYVNEYGYLKVKATADKLAVVFNCIDQSYGKAFDSIVIDLKTRTVIEGVKGVEPL
jgi:hypothetical protein